MEEHEPVHEPTEEPEVSDSENAQTLENTSASGTASNDKPSEKKGEAKKTKSTAREVLGWILAIAIAVAAAFIIRAFLFEFVLVEGPSMQPTLETGERIGIEKVTRYTSLPKRGDIVIVKYPNRDGNFVKRTIGLPGETIEIIDSTVYVDGQPLEEDYVSDAPYSDMAPVVVPEDHIFVMGDNRANSSDSRSSQVGPIPSSSIVGHGLFVIWPFSSAHMITQ